MALKQAMIEATTRREASLSWWFSHWQTVCLEFIIAKKPAWNIKKMIRKHQNHRKPSILFAPFISIGRKETNSQAEPLPVLSSPINSKIRGFRLWRRVVPKDASRLSGKRSGKTCFYSVKSSELGEVDIGVSDNTVGHWEGPSIEICCWLFVVGDNVGAVCVLRVSVPQCRHRTTQVIAIITAIRRHSDFEVNQCL